MPVSNYAGKKNVKFHFLFKSATLSNNIYIDDFNITGTVGLNEQENAAFSFDAYPNPATESFNISYELKQPEDVTISLYDLQGRLVREIEKKHLAPGTYENKIEAKSFDLNSGVYILKMQTKDGLISKKLVYSGN